MTNIIHRYIGVCLRYVMIARSLLFSPFLIFSSLSHFFLSTVIEAMMILLFAYVNNLFFFPHSCCCDTDAHSINCDLYFAVFSFNCAFLFPLSLTSETTTRTNVHPKKLLLSINFFFAILTYVKNKSISIFFL